MSEASDGFARSRLASLLSIAADAIILLDREQRILLFNEGAERIFGWKAEEVVGDPLDRLLPERFRKVHRRHIEDFVSSPVASRRMGERGKIFGLRKGAEEFPAEASIAKIGKGEDTTLTVVLRDITDRTRAEEELRKRERQLEEAQAIAHLGSWEWDVEADVVWWSDELYRIYGVPPGTSITFDDFLSRVHPEDRERVRDAVGRAFEEKAPFSFVHRIRRPDGTVRILHGRGRPVPDEDGRLIRMVGTGQDITDRVRAERKARRLAAEQAARAEAETTARRMEFLAEAGRVLAGSLDYETTVRNIADLPVPFLAEYAAVFVEDEDGPLRLAASAHARPDLEEAIARVEASYRPDPENPDSLMGRVYRTGEPRRLGELPRERLERAVAGHPGVLDTLREVAPRSAIMVPLETRNRKLGVLALYRSAEEPAYEEADLLVAMRLAGKAALALDNARLYQSERVARAEAEEATALRDEVLAIIAHDLRSPLHTISLCGELLGRDGPDEAQEKNRRLLQRSVRRMSRLVQDLLDVGRIETAGLTLEREPAEPAELVEEAVQAARPSAASKGVDLVGDAAGPLPVTEVDRPRLQQVFSNLLENAIRHTPSGGRIEVFARAENGDVRFGVRDTGEGIPEARRRELFDRVWQVREGGGTRAGLGLTIVRGIVEGHEGRVWVESEPGEGSTFYFEIPSAAEPGERRAS